MTKQERFWIDKRKIGYIYINDGSRHMSWNEVAEKLNEFDNLLDIVMRDNDRLIDLAERGINQKKQFQQKTLNLIDREIKQIDDAIRKDLNLPTDVEVDIQILRVLTRIRKEVESYE